MEYIVALVSAIGNAIVAYTTLDKKGMKKIRILGEKEEQQESKELSKSKKTVIVILATCLTFICSTKIMKDVSGVINEAKMLITLLCLTGSACVDYREKRIPNFFPAMLLMSGIFLLAIGYFSKQPDAMAYIYSSVFGAVSSFLLLLGASFLTKQGIGAGDIKLISTLAFTCGIYTLCGTIFYGIVLCSIVAVVCLITKKKTLQESLPFGPFIALGYVITILNSVY